MDTCADAFFSHFLNKCITRYGISSSPISERAKGRNSFDVSKVRAWDLTFRIEGIENLISF